MQELNAGGRVQDAASIGQHVIDAVLAGRLKAGTRLGEQHIAQMFSVSRTVVREALIRLETRGIVQVTARRGWFVIEPSIEEAREAFNARRAIELGLLTSVHEIQPQAIEALSKHIALERESIDSGDVAARSYLLGDFHVCMAEALGNRLLSEILRDMTARTVLISMLYQSTHDAAESCDEHEQIVAALQNGDRKEAIRLMAAHIGNVEAGLTVREDPEPDPLQGLRDMLHAPSASARNTPKPTALYRRQDRPQSQPVKRKSKS
jgi:DNA-binding GntR family transcriptional regulator